MDPELLVDPAEHVADGLGRQERLLRDLRLDSPWRRARRRVAPSRSGRAGARGRRPIRPSSARARSAQSGAPERLEDARAPRAGARRLAASPCADDGPGPSRGASGRARTASAGARVRRGLVAGSRGRASRSPVAASSRPRPRAPIARVHGVGATRAACSSQSTIRVGTVEVADAEGGLEAVAVQLEPARVARPARLGQRRGDRQLDVGVADVAERTGRRSRGCGGGRPRGRGRRSRWPARAPRRESPGLVDAALDRPRPGRRRATARTGRRRRLRGRSPRGRASARRARRRPDRRGRPAGPTASTRLNGSSPPGPDLARMSRSVIAIARSRSSSLAGEPVGDPVGAVVLPRAPVLA